MTFSRYNIMCDVISPYYVMQPFDFGGSYFHCMLVYSKEVCPSYSPFSLNTNCRLCGQNAANHKKYYAYSNYARIIQKKAIRYVYEKMCKSILKEIKLNINFIDFYVKKERYFYKKYRNWNKQEFYILILQN